MLADFELDKQSSDSSVSQLPMAKKLKKNKEMVCAVENEKMHSTCSQQKNFCSMEKPSLKSNKTQSMDGQHG